MTEKIQYFMSDLEHILKIGEIKEIHVADQNGRPVLRITCDSEPKYDYKTVVVPKGKPGTTQQKKPTKPATKSAEPETWPEKIAAGAKDFFLNPQRNKGKFGGGGF
jgi:hypothetical protein